jgi:hypothetical protein
MFPNAFPPYIFQIATSHNIDNKTYFFAVKVKAVIHISYVRAFLIYVQREKYFI